MWQKNQNFYFLLFEHIFCLFHIKFERAHHWKLLNFSCKIHIETTVYQILPSKAFFPVMFCCFIEVNNCSDVWGVTKTKNIDVKVTVLLELPLCTKSLFSRFCGKNLVFLLKPPCVLLPISKEPKRLETNFFFWWKKRVYSFFR